jgi:hypothetical protein
VKARKRKVEVSKKDLIFILTLCSVLPLATNCTKLPDNNGRTPTYAVNDGDKTRLGRDFGELLKNQDPEH